MKKICANVMPRTFQKRMQARRPWFSNMIKKLSTTNSELNILSSGFGMFTELESTEKTDSLIKQNFNLTILLPAQLLFWPKSRVRTSTTLSRHCPRDFMFPKLEISTDQILNLLKIFRLMV